MRLHIELCRTQTRTAVCTSSQTLGQFGFPHKQSGAAGFSAGHTELHDGGRTCAALGAVVNFHSNTRGTVRSNLAYPTGDRCGQFSGLRSLSRPDEVGSTAAEGWEYGGAFASMSEWAAQPLLAYRILQDPGAYADTLTLRFDLQNALSSTGLPSEDQLRVRDPAAKPYKEMPELVVGIIHQRVFEAFWNDGETFPSRVVVDDVLN